MKDPNLKLFEKLDPKKTAKTYLDKTGKTFYTGDYTNSNDSWFWEKLGFDTTPQMGTLQSSIFGKSENGFLWKKKFDEALQELVGQRLRKLDPKQTAKDYFEATGIGHSQGMYGTGNEAPWFWQKLGLDLSSGIGRSEDGFQWKKEFDEALEELDRKSRRQETENTIETLYKLALESGKEKTGLTETDLKVLSYKANIEVRDLRFTHALLNDKLLGERVNNRRETISQQTKDLVKKRQNYRCAICGQKESSAFSLHIDHIKPVSRGGTNDLDNLQALCPKCNSKKGAN